MNMNIQFDDRYTQASGYKIELTFGFSTLLYSIWYVTMMPFGDGGSSHLSFTVPRLSFSTSTTSFELSTLSALPVTQ